MDAKDIEQFVKTCRDAGFPDEKIADELDRYARDMLRLILDGVKPEELPAIAESAYLLRKQAEQLR